MSDFKSATITGGLYQPENMNIKNVNGNKRFIEMKVW